MERAKDLLESSFLSVKEIAYQVGLNDESHFVRDFKSTYGLSPAIYRSHFRNNGGSADAHNSNNGKQPNRVRQALIQASKQSLLPSLPLFVQLFSYLN
jgi:AraC-like DNA-binding protein